MRTHAVAAAAGLLLGLEGIGILALAGLQVAALAAGDNDSVVSAIALIVLTVVGAAAVIAFAVAVLRDRSWGRSGGIVTQLLILAVAGGALTGAYAHPVIGVEIGLPAVVVFVLLVLAAVEAGRRAKLREAPED